MVRMRGSMIFMVAMIVAGSVLAKPTANDVPFPDGFRDWFLVNTMIVTKDSPISDQIGGLHHIYVNRVAFPTLKASGPYPYPDGSVFADDVHEFSVKDGSYVEGNKKAVTVMVKDAKKYASTGGWGFQVRTSATAGATPTAGTTASTSSTAACTAAGSMTSLKLIATRA